MDERLEALTAGPWTDAPRFHPPGSHPAVWRHRQQLRKLRELQAQGADASEAIAYIERLLADFEQRESDVKAHYFAMLND